MVEPMTEAVIDVRGLVKTFGRTGRSTGST